MTLFRLLLSRNFCRTGRHFQSTLQDVKTRREAIKDIIAKIEKNKEATKHPFMDTYGRTHNYLRISLTEKCNLRCLYCMPEDGVSLSPEFNLLTSNEIIRLVELFASHGVDKVRLTGGEPTIRKDIVELVGRIRNVTGIKEIGITSNGIVLAKKIRQLRDAGLTKVNISLDTLDQHKYMLMTRRNGFAKVMKCIELAEMLFPIVKVNTVVMKNVNDNEVSDFVRLTENRRLDVRFIEYMPFGGNHFSQKKFVDYKTLLIAIEKAFDGLVLRLPDAANDTSKGYKINGFVGRFGFITSMSEHFCATCNRLRLTADGNLKVCLHSSAEVSMRDLLRNGASDEEISRVIQKAVERKKKSHSDYRNGKFGAHAQQTYDPYRRINKYVMPFYATNYTFLSFPSSSTQLSTIRSFFSKVPDDSNRLSHISKDGTIAQVDISHKPQTFREAVAEGKIFLTSEVTQQIKHNQSKKGDVLNAARIASVIGAKLTATIIPLSHNIPISYVNTEFRLDESQCILFIRSTARTTSNTGIEMEALTACTVAALTVYDMCKSVTQEMVIRDIRLVSKSGGKTDYKISGDF